MKIIIPMAGMGKRMRPHTLTIPKPLIAVAGKPIVEWLVEDLVKVCNEKVNEIAFVIGRFGEETEKKLIAIAEKQGAKGTIHYQDEALGTAHAIMCAESALTEKTIVAFADTLFKADFKLQEENDSIIWVHKVEDPRAFGVVKLNDKNEITDFVEKPEHFVSDLAIIGIYYFKDGETLKKELKYLLDNDIKEKGEYQLTNALENMKNKGLRFVPGKVEEWLDCGNKDATVYTNRRMLEIKQKELPKINHTSYSNSVVIEPCFIGHGVKISNSVVGPYVSLGDGTIIENSNISNSIIQKSAKIKNAHISNSMLGNNSEYHGKPADLSISDYTTIK
ncbi:MAG: sugar phosphate nucleotidyltransferase [Bacteroidia bacterium]